MPSNPIESYLESEHIAQITEPARRKSAIDSVVASMSSNVIYALNSGQITAEEAGIKIKEIFNLFREEYSL